MNGIRMGFLTATVVVAFTAALAARFWMIEPRGAELMCSMSGAAAWCPLRAALIPVFDYQGFGLASLATGLFAAILCRPAWGVPAVAFGAMGLVLYNVELAAVGIILGLIAVFRNDSHPAA